MQLKRLYQSTLIAVGLCLYTSFASSEELSVPTFKGYKWLTVSDDERAKMDTAVAQGLSQNFSDYAARGISNAEEIYNPLNS